MSESLKDLVQVEVNRLYRESGGVSASQLVEAARPKKSPIHDAFQWDDSKAAAEHRLLQARQWIKRVKIIVEDKAETVVHVPAVTVAGEKIKEGVYKPIIHVVSNANEYALALQEITNGIKALERSYNRLTEAFKRVGKSKKRESQVAKIGRGIDTITSALKVEKKPHIQKSA